MMKSWCAMAAVLAALTVSMSGCGGGKNSEELGASASTSGGGDDYTVEIQAGDYLVLGTLTDNKDHPRAKQNVEDTLINHPNVACMVGLWAYNPPMILSALENKGKKGKIAVVGFDENDVTLQGIADGYVHGTIAQQPYLFGYRSVEYLAAKIRGQELENIGDQNYIPIKVIKKHNVAEFKTEVQDILSGKSAPPEHNREYDTQERVKVAFLTNSVDDFWLLAQRGCELAARNLNVECRVIQPADGTVEQQKRSVEDFITDGFQALAITAIDPENQVEMINHACDKMIVICHDSDAPKTKRKFYLGTSNYLAGRAAGKLVKEAIPEGGEVMIFVGKMEVLNAQERRRGVIDELAGKPIPAEYGTP